jgi:Spy/CpxP family protein refolding chaperone
MSPIRLLWILALAAPLAAQQPDSAARPWMHKDGGMGMEGMMGHGDHMMNPMMMRVTVFSPAHLLMHRDVLTLTDQQVTKLTALRDAAKTAEGAARDDAEKHGREMETAFASPSPDTTALKTHFQAMHAAMGKAHWTMLTAAAQARAVLTDTQRARAEGWADAMSRMGSMMGHGMHDGMHDGDSMHH